MLSLMHYTLLNFEKIYSQYTLSVIKRVNEMVALRKAVWLRPQKMVLGGCRATHATVMVTDTL